MDKRIRRLIIGGNVRHALATIRDAPELDLHYRDINGNNLLMYAVRWGQIEIGEALIDRGSRVDDRDQSGKTNLIYAIMTQSDEMCAMLIRRGADPNLSCMYSPLHYAIDCLKPTVARLLIEHGANVGAVGFPYPRLTYMHRFLHWIASHANIYFGQTPLMVAAYMKDTPMCKYLCWKGADYSFGRDHRCDGYYMKAFMLAVNADAWETVKFLNHDHTRYLFIRLVSAHLLPLDLLRNLFEFL